MPPIHGGGGPTFSLTEPAPPSSTRTNPPLRGGCSVVMVVVIWSRGIGRSIEGVEASFIDGQGRVG